MQHVSDLHPKFALKPHHVWKYGIQSPTAKIRRGKTERRRRKKKPQGKNIVSASAMQGGHNDHANLTYSWIFGAPVPNVLANQGRIRRARVYVYPQSTQMPNFTRIDLLSCPWGAKIST